MNNRSGYENWDSDGVDQDYKRQQERAKEAGF